MQYQPTARNAIMARALITVSRYQRGSWTSALARFIRQSFARKTMPGLCPRFAGRGKTESDERLGGGGGRESAGIKLARAGTGSFQVSLLG